jgi:alpha-ribazole phosphatase
MKIHLIRHTAVDVPTGVCYGRSDVPPAETFPIEAEAVRARLAGRFVCVYTSPSLRCTRLAKACGYPDATRDARLAELDFGAWELRRWEDTDAQVRWREDWIDTPPPGGESLRRMYARVASFFDALRRDTDVLVFTHAGVIRCARAYFGETPLEKSFDTPVACGEIVTMIG